MNMKLNISKLIRAVVTPIVNLFLRHKKLEPWAKCIKGADHAQKHRFTKKEGNYKLKRTYNIIKDTILTSEVCDLSSEAGPGPEPETELEEAIHRRGAAGQHCTCHMHITCAV